MENFRRPNFELVADILFWMVKLYDPEAVISDKVERENDRVDFLTGIAALMATKARIKLNTKKLYASDGRAVQELLKLASLLYRATQSVSTVVEGDQSVTPIKVQDVKIARTLASDITQRGAKLYDLLAAEKSNRDERSQAMRFLDLAGSSAEGSKEHSHIERSLREIIDQTHRLVDDVRKECEELEADEKAIEGKIKKKQEELERNEKRLRSLENVRPPFMDEVEKLEKDLQRHYEVYMEKFRNLDYLEHELEQYYKNEEERRLENERRLKKMRERLLREEVELLRGAGNREDVDDEPPVQSNRNNGNGGGKKPVDSGGRGASNGGATRSNGGAKPVPKVQVQGSMHSLSDDDDSSNSEEGDGSGDSDGSDEDEISVGSKDMGRRGGGGGGGGGGGNKRGGGGGGSDQNSSDEFMDEDDDDDDDDDEDMGDDDGEGSGSSENF
eukprot:gene6988-14203_t